MGKLKRKTKILDLIRKLAKNFDLKYSSKSFVYLVMSKEEIVLRNFLGGCPEPDFNKFSGKKKDNRLKNILKFVNSREFIKHKKKPQGCVILLKEAKHELNLAKKIRDKNLKKKFIKIYGKINKNIGKCGLILISRPETKMEQRIMKNILSHELVHQLLISNNIEFYEIRHSLWVWDEGLCVYMDHFIYNEQDKFKDKPKKIKGKLWQTYGVYAHKWYKLFDNIKNPKERKKIILKKKKNLNEKLVKKK